MFSSETSARTPKRKRTGKNWMKLFKERQEKFSEQRGARRSYDVTCEDVWFVTAKVPRLQIYKRLFSSHFTIKNVCTITTILNIDSLHFIHVLIVRELIFLHNCLKACGHDGARALEESRKGWINLGFDIPNIDSVSRPLLEATLII